MREWEESKQKEKTSMTKIELTLYSALGRLLQDNLMYAYLAVSKNGTRHEMIKFRSHKPLSEIHTPPSPLDFDAFG
jgi:hypothetical protein